MHLCVTDRAARAEALEQLRRLLGARDWAAHLSVAKAHHRGGTNPTALNFVDAQTGVAVEVSLDDDTQSAVKPASTFLLLRY
jgi:hypothetical protein